MNCQCAWNVAFNIASRPNTNCVGVARAAVCTAEFIAFEHATRTSLKSRRESRSRFILDLCTANHVVKCLVTSFNHGVRLWIATGNNLPFDTMFILKTLADFSGEFSSFVHSYFCRPWTSGKPVDFKPIGYYHVRSEESR